MESAVQKTLQIVAADRGFVYIGHVQKDGDDLLVTQAKTVRRWGTTKGLGQLALEGPQQDTKLDETGTVRVPGRAVISVIEVQNVDAWAGHFANPAEAA
jgi:hypothetical protein